MQLGRWLLAAVVLVTLGAAACASPPAAPAVPKEAAPAAPKAAPAAAPKAAAPAAPPAAAPAAPKEAAAPARGPVFPEKPVTVIVPFPAGGGVDQTARQVSEAIKPFLPQPLVVVNRPGGNSAIGTAEVLQAKPDGYTIGLSGGSLMLVHLITDAPWKGPDDYRPIIKFFDVPIFFVIRTDSPWKTMKEVMEYAKANPGKFRVGTAGRGSSFGIALESLKEKSGVNLTHVPFAGTGEIIPQLLGGHVEGGILAGGEPLPNVKAGKFKVVATFEEKRVQVYQDAPTLRELGYDVLAGLNSYLSIGPKALPDQPAQVLHDAMKKAAETPAFKKFGEDGGMVLAYKGLADLKQELDRKNTAFGEAVKRLNLRQQ